MDELAREFRLAAESIERSKACLEIVAGQSDRIRQNADKLEPILKGIDERQKALADHLSAFADMSQKAREVFPIIEKRLNELTSDLSECVKGVLKSIEDQGTQIQSMADTTNRKIETIMGRTGDNVESLVKRTAEVMEKQVSELDKELSSELTKSLQSLGSQLTSLSAKFVEDYSPLTEKLRDVVQMARRATNA